MLIEPLIRQESIRNQDDQIIINIFTVAEWPQSSTFKLTLVDNHGQFFLSLKTVRPSDPGSSSWNA